MKHPVTFWIGESLQGIAHTPAGWRLSFGAAGALTLHCLWRVLEGGRIVLASRDGPAAKIEAEAKKLLLGRKVTAAQVAEDTRDIVLTFEGGVTFQAINDSALHDAWQGEFTMPPQDNK